MAVAAVRGDLTEAGLLEAFRDLDEARSGYTFEMEADPAGLAAEFRARADAL